MKFNDEYDSERHMEMVGKYMPGRKKFFVGEIFDSRISLQVAMPTACNNWQTWMEIIEVTDRPIDPIKELLHIFVMALYACHCTCSHLGTFRHNSLARDYEWPSVDLSSQRSFCGVTCRHPSSSNHWTHDVRAFISWGCFWGA